VERQSKNLAAYFGLPNSKILDTIKGSRSKRRGRRIRGGTGKHAVRAELEINLLRVLSVCRRSGA